MSSCRKLIALLALGGFLALPAAALADPPDPAQLKKDYEELRKVNDELGKLIQEQRALLKALADIQDLKQRLLSLEQKMDVLQKDPTRRISLAPPQSGTIRLENRLGLPATIIVNDIAYRLQPFQTRELVSQPAGAFTFEALVEGFGALQPRTARTLLPNAVYTIFTFQPY